MKRRSRRLALFLAAVMALSLLPPAALAGYEDDWYSYRQKWLYTATADRPSVEGTPAGTNIRDGQNEDGSHQNMPVQTYDFGTLEYGKTAEAALTLEFENVTDLSGVAVPAGNANRWGEVALTIPAVSRYFSFKWNGENGGRMGQGEKASVTITPRSDITLPAGSLEDYALFMDQNSRVGWGVKLTIKVERRIATVTMPKQVEKSYGQTLTGADIKVTLDGKETTLKELGVGIQGTGIGPEATVGDKTYTISPDTSFVAFGDFDITLEGKSQVSVLPAQPQLVNIYAGRGTEGGKVSSVELTGRYVNPYTRKDVPGSFQWDTPDAEIVDGGVYAYTFTPEDSVNYVESVPGSAPIYKVAISTSGDGTEPVEIKVDEASLTQTYTGRKMGIRYETNFPDREKITVAYRKASGEGGWQVNDPPVDAGEYDVTIRVPGGYRASDGKNYIGTTAAARMVIAPKPVEFNVEVYSRPYKGEGDTEGQIMNGSIRNLSSGDVGKVELVCDSGSGVKECLIAEYEDGNVGKNKTVKLTYKPGCTLTGDRASNYALPESIPPLTNGEIFSQKVVLALKGAVTKFYGQTMNFSPEDFTASGGLVDGDVVDSLQLIASSAGADPGANVNSGGYSVFASSGNPNYSVESVKGNMRVEPAVPELVSISASRGCIGRTAGTIAASLQGTFRNPYSGEAVPGTVALTAASRDTVLKEETELEYVFTPSSANHTAYTGKVTVESSEKQPADIAIAGQTSFVYDGQPKKVEGVSSVTGNIVVKYDLDGDGAFESDDAPVDVGEYAVKVMADLSDNDEYEDNEITATLIVTPAAPSGEAAASKVEEGAALSDSKLTASITGVDGKPIQGKIGWDNVGAETPDQVKVVVDAHYNWTFIPESKNYTSLSGSAVPCAAAPESEEKPGGEGGGSGSSSGSSSSGSGGGGGSSFGGGATSSQSAKTESTSTTNADGSVTKTVTGKDGSVTKTTTWPDGAVSETVTAKDGSSTSKSTSAGGVVTETATTAEGRTTGKVTIPEGLAGGADVSLPKELGKAEGRVTVRVSYPGGREERLRGKYAEGSIAVHVDASAAVEVLSDYVPYTAALPFQDIPASAWYYDAVWNSYYDGMMTGTGDTSFSPDELTDRAMVATVLWRLLGEPKTDAAVSYTDVGGGNWYSDAIRWASAEGVITGYGDGSFGPGNAITREQLAVMLYRFEKSKGGEAPAEESLQMDFADAGDISGWAYEAMCWCVRSGILSGRGNGLLDPGGQATRAEAAKMLNSYVEL